MFNLTISVSQSLDRRTENRQGEASSPRESLTENSQAFDRQRKSTCVLLRQV